MNVGGPSWRQYVIDKSLIPFSVTLGGTILAGSINIKVSKTIKTYNDNQRYYLGDVVLFKKTNYLNLAYNDPRGLGYSGSYRSSPEKDKNVWVEVQVEKAPVESVKSSLPSGMKFSEVVDDVIKTYSQT